MNRVTALAKERKKKRKGREEDDDDDDVRKKRKLKYRKRRKKQAHNIISRITLPKFCSSLFVFFQIYSNWHPSGKKQTIKKNIKFVH